ncbi:DUF5691 domain-containing protein [Propionibacterium australiense]|uniref:Armadillo-type fold n=1 Tax=Propionibacterium australiense TaxID=119981 RepID=A0A383S4Y3_9ACTN|nr:DUF5691 domain-containing protein [Propionibacterium australiense]RLP10004.1 hypothetical protein D9T14_05530 [Propionibacterium australiense]RLP11289.1 hypothetical protein D7U36_03970 [Propionibacterium australiense]SYZ32913.1 Armadillo-type fold [Propionibacterium australiense]VEH92442.1 Uncharacterised protein [Propionibacterium australiense]
MSGFSELVRCATVGLSTRPFTADGLEPEVRSALAEGSATAADLALDAAAAYAVAHRARIGSPQTRTLHLPPRTREPVPPRLEAMLRRMFEDLAQRPLFYEAMSLVGARGWTLPPDLLLRVLDFIPGTRHAHEVMDDRARALLDTDTPGRGEDPRRGRALWDEGTSHQRANYLEQVRRDDPAAAWTLLDDGTWLSEEPKMRSWIVSRVEIGLGPDDEPHLEALLDDKHAAVRAAAARLLGSIEGSRTVRQAEELVRTHLAVRAGPPGPPVIDCTPIEPTDELIRDGYDWEHVGTPMPVTRLQLAVSRVPSRRLPGLIGLSTTDLASARVLLEGADISEAFRDTLKGSARKHHDTELAEALLRARPEPSRLLDVLDASRREQLILELFDTPTLVEFGERFWPRPLSRAMLHRLAEAIAWCIARRGLSIELSELCTVMARGAPAELMPEALSLLEAVPVTTKQDARSVEQALSHLRGRQELTRIIDEETP